MQARVSEPIRVLVVDDSAFIRFTLTRRLNQGPISRSWGLPPTDKRH